MSLPALLVMQLREVLREAAGEDHLRSVTSVSGGDISQAFRLTCDNGSYFLKLNDTTTCPGMFAAEAKGLRLIGDSAPVVLAEGELGAVSFLLMRWIDSAENTPAAQTNLGRVVADLHRVTASEFGLDHDNYIGSLRQSNSFHADWTSFFIAERLQPLLKMAYNSGNIDAPLVGDFERLFGRLDHLFPHEPPALLHGDLWSGNYLIARYNLPVLIDPACYFGHREMDIAMSRLFGGFSPSFYASYHAHFPLQPGWERRVSLWNLYPLLVHVNLFGSGYLSQLKTSLNQWL